MQIPDEITREFLLAFREEYNLSQKELAECIGVSLKTVQNWECPPDKPSHRKPRKVSVTAFKHAKTTLERRTETKALKAQAKKQRST